MKTLEEIKTLITTLSESDLQFLIDFGDEPILRKFLLPTEIINCNRFVKMGLMYKGISDDSQNNRTYYIDKYIYTHYLIK